MIMRTKIRCGSFTVRVEGSPLATLRLWWRLLPLLLGPDEKRRTVMDLLERSALDRGIQVRRDYR
jgi:hypothetical protein